MTPQLASRTHWLAYLTGILGAFLIMNEKFVNKNLRNLWKKS